MTKEEALEGLQRIREQIIANKEDGILRIDAFCDEYGEFLIKEVLHFKSREEFKDGFLKKTDEFLKVIDEKEEEIKKGELDGIFEKE